MNELGRMWVVCLAYLTQEGTPGSYSVIPGYFGNFLTDWAQLSFSSRLGPTDCASPDEPDLTSDGPCCRPVGDDDGL